MDLKDFIKSTLTQIIQAIGETNEEIKDSKAIVSPRGFYHADGRYQVPRDKDLAYHCELVDFDVAVSAREEKGNTGGVAVTIAAIGLGTKRNSEVENSTASRIRFKIPVLLPQNDASHIVPKR